MAEKTFRLWGGGGAAEHMFLVAAGLDSAKVGETEILGQLRRALDTARQADTCGARLGLILEESLKVASKVREATQLDRGRTSLAEIALERTRDRLAGGGGSVALVGVSPMTERCGRALGGEGVPLIVVNRTLERARAFAAEVAGDPRSLEQFREDPDPVEVVILATGAPVAVLTRATLERLAARAPSGQPR